MYRLIETSEGLKLENTQDKKEQPVFVDFHEPGLAFRCRPEKVAHEPLAKAIGWKPGKSLKICDATAGLGVDAFIMAAMGNDVTLVERNPILLKLLKDGFKRAQDSLGAILARMHLVEQDSTDYLQGDVSFDVIYCDPMFPARKKSALVNKSMRALHHIVGVDQDAQELIKIALTKATKRVVVKGPRLSTPASKPDFSYTYKACRFDVYLPKI